jgi:xylan 1,4-beta-xylosidase
MDTYVPATLPTLGAARRNAFKIHPRFQRPTVRETNWMGCLRPPGSLPTSSRPCSPLPPPARTCRVPTPDVMRILCLLPCSVFVAALLPAATPPRGPAPLAVSIQVDAAQPVGELKPIWRFFGADEPNYATMKDGEKLLGELGELRPREVYFRTHNLLCTGDGTPSLKWGSTNAYTEDAAGNPIYDWSIVDRIFDSYLARGVRPLVQIGFMPQALSISPEPYRHEWRPGLPYQTIITGWAYPPKDYDKWRELSYQWVKHCIERYGREEVEQWYWQVWNEPNGDYWMASREEFYKLHDYAIDGVRRALPTARVGGPHVAGSGGAMMDGFLEHIVRGTNYATGKIGTPTDYLSFHAKGQPTVVDGRVRLGMHQQLKAIDNGFRKIAAVPELKRLPIVIGESDPDGCAACTASVYPQNAYRSGSMYASYTAASFARKYQLAERHGVNLEGALTWAFEFEDQPYFAGFRVLATNGINLPVLNVFRMMSRLGPERLSVRSSAEVPLDTMLSEGVRGEFPDVSALAARAGESVAALVWHYHDDDLPGPEATVTLVVTGLPAHATSAKLTHYRIDDDHSNAFTAWQRQGAPAGPNVQQYQELVAAGALQTLQGAPDTIALQGGTATVQFSLPRQGVSLIIIHP